MTARQDIEIEMALPTPNSRLNRWQASDLIKGQRAKTRRGLETMGVLVEVPLRVTLIRVSRGTADDDRSAMSLAAVRDELARWAHGIPAYVIGRNGKPRVPRAPDGPSDGIVWRYGQQKTKRIGYQAARIIIETQEDGP